MPSVSPGKQLAVVLLCGAIGAGGLAGCSTTQEKAAAKQAESERILKARAKRHHGPQSQNQNADGTKSPTKDDKSAHRRSELDESAHGRGRDGRG